MENDHGNQSVVIIDRLPRWAHMLALGIYIVLLMLAFVANLLVIFTIYRVKSMRRCTGGTMNILLGNLALADLLLAISTTLEAAAVFRHSWELGVAACKLQRWFMYSFYGVSMLSLVAISVERYYAICDPLNSKVLNNTSLSRVYKTIGAVWIAALLLESPQLYISDLEFTHRATVCKDVQPLKHKLYIAVLIAYYKPLFILLYALPLGLFSVMFYKIGRKLRGVEERLRERSRHEVLSVVQKRKRVLRVLLAVVIIFVCCWTPFNCVQLISRDTRLAEYDPLGNFYVSIKMLALCHAVLSPIIWTLMGQQFRDGLKRALRFTRGEPIQTNLPVQKIKIVRERPDTGQMTEEVSTQFRPRLHRFQPREVTKQPSKLDLFLSSLTPKVGQGRVRQTKSTLSGISNDGAIIEDPLDVAIIEEPLEDDVFSEQQECADGNDVSSKC